MKAEAVREKLATIISKAEKITGRSNTLPILKCVLVEAGNNKLTIKSTNLDLGIEISLPAKVSTEGKVAIPGTVLSSFLNNLNNEKSVNLELVESNIHISASKNTTVIKSFPSEEFPNIPRIESPNGFSINSDDFIEGLKSVHYSAATSSIKPELSSIKIFPEQDEIVFVATDGFRLAEKKIKTNKNLEFPPILVPVKNVNEIIRVIDGLKSEISVLIDKNQMAILTDELYLVSRTTEGNFPNYKAIFPKEFISESNVLKQDLVNGLKLSTIFTDAFNHIKLVVHAKEGQMELISKNNDIGENSSTITASVKGEDVGLNFNFRYISDSFNSFRADSLTFMFSGANTPLVIKGIGDSSFSYVVMPMNR